MMKKGTVRCISEYVIERHPGLVSVDGSLDTVERLLPMCCNDVRNRYKFFIAAFFLLVCLLNSKAVFGCRLFGANGNVTKDSITILAKGADLFWRPQQKIWYSPRANHSEDDTIHFGHISIPQCSLTYKFIATNSLVRDRTTNWGVNEYGLAIVSHAMSSWDDDSLGTEYFDGRDYGALILARCQNVQEAIDLFDELILPHGIGAASYLIADPEELWLMETTGYNYVAKPIIDDVVSCLHRRYTIGTDWDDPGNRNNADLLANAEHHGCDTDPLNFSECFNDSGYPPHGYDPELLSLKDRGDITVEDMRALVSDKSTVHTAAACVIPVRPDKDPAFFSCMWDSRANPKYGNVYLPYWLAITDTALPVHYTSWPPDDSLCAWNVFSEIAADSALRIVAEPIWRVLQAELYAEFDTLEAQMQVYLDSGDSSGLREYINGYVYGELENAYDVATDIIEFAGLPSPVADLTTTLSGENLRLQWSMVTSDRLGNPVVVDQYRIYQDTVAFFDPGSGPFDSTASAFYVDTSGVGGDTGFHYFYAVTAVSGGKESDFSNMVGEFGKGLMVE
jgi:hypothetical protein